MYKPSDPFVKIPFTCSAFANATSPKSAHPEINSSAPIDAIVRTFFQNDVVLIRGALNADRIKSVYQNTISQIYHEDDKKIANKYQSLNEAEFHELKGGWITDERLRRLTNNTINLEDIFISHIYTRLADRIMDTTNWKKHGSSYIRRIHHKEDHDKGYNSLADMHIGALMQPEDNFTLTFFIPLTSIGINSPGLQFVLASTQEIKKYTRYNSKTPYEKIGASQTNSRLDEKQFLPENYDKAFGPERRWNPELVPGDILIYSDWAMFMNRFPLISTQDSIAIEYKIHILPHDTTARQKYTLS